VVDFDFRMTPGFGRSDGLGLALLNTANFGLFGPVEPQPPLFAGEEPNFAGSLGVGLDIYQSTVMSQTELNNNHVSIHFNGALGRV
jgi:hypothetical protein